MNTVEEMALDLMIFCYYLSLGTVTDMCISVAFFMIDLILTSANLLSRLPTYVVSTLFTTLSNLLMKEELTELKASLL